MMQAAHDALLPVAEAMMKKGPVVCLVGGSWQLLRDTCLLQRHDVGQQGTQQAMQLKPASRTVCGRTSPARCTTEAKL